MKIAILGATGMLGSMLVDYLSKYFEVVATTRSRGYKPPEGVEIRYLDVFSEVGKVIRDCRWVINAIGAIPQRVRSNEEMLIINANFPIDLAKIIDCPILQITTDCVYSGQKGNYIETDTPDPIDDYGKSKLKGEIKSPNMFHIRCSIVGPETHWKSLLGWFLSSPLKATVSGYANHLWNGVTTLHFAKVCKGIIVPAMSLPHVQHLVPADSITKYELLKLFAHEFGREDITIKPMKAPGDIDRTLATMNPEINLELWRNAGYSKPPTIAQMVKELAEYIRVYR